MASRSILWPLKVGWGRESGSGGKKKNELVSSSKKNAFLQGRGRAANCCYHVGVRALWCVCVSLGHVHARASVRALCERRSCIV